jgi:bacteriocin-like protein
MAITKCLIGVPLVNRFTVTARALHQCGRTSDWMVRAGLMEKIMSKGNDSSKLGRATQVRELRDDELQQVSGGSRGVHLSEIVVTKPMDVASTTIR